LTTFDIIYEGSDEGKNIIKKSFSKEPFSSNVLIQFETSNQIDVTLHSIEDNALI
jgi:hypothetical protein